MAARRALSGLSASISIAVTTTLPFQPPNESLARPAEQPVTSLARQSHPLGRARRLTIRSVDAAKRG
jgi:hypothetical protein